jgi:hypothetical protein
MTVVLFRETKSEGAGQPKGEAYNVHKPKDRRPEKHPADNIYNHNHHIHQYANIGYHTGNIAQLENNAAEFFHQILSLLLTNASR